MVSVYFTDINNGFAVGTNGIIVRTSNGGINWENSASGTSNDLTSVFFADQNKGWIVGNAGTIIRTIDGGINWEVQTSVTSDDLFSVHFINSDHGWISGENGTLLKTTDNGTSWVEQTGITRFPLYSIFFTDVNTGWAVGAFGTIIKTTNGGVTFIDDDETADVPTEFLLYQNYPNPFNPTTNIEFRIADFGFVSLKVYDVLGNEIATLVNEEKPVGSYEVEFDASSFPSGIYFYQLRAGEFIQSKKMSLIK